MVTKIIKQLKEASENLDNEISSAKRGIRPLDESKASKARMLVQEAITILLATR